MIKEIDKFQEYVFPPLSPYFDSVVSITPSVYIFHTLHQKGNNPIEYYVLIKANNRNMTFKK